MILIFSNAFSQLDTSHFYKVGSNGKVVNKRTGHIVKDGDLVYSKDTLMPDREDYYIMVMNKSGMYELYPTGPQQRHFMLPGEFFVTVSKALKKERKKLGTKGIDTKFKYADMERFFHPGDTIAGNRILMLEQDKVKAEEVLLANGNYFFLAPVDNDNEIHRIDSKKDSLLFRRKGPSRSDSIRGDITYYLYFVHGNDQPRSITDCRIVFISDEDALTLADNFLDKHTWAGDGDDGIEMLMNDLDYLFTRCYSAAPRGILLKQLLERRVLHYINAHRGL